tara:strand:+ start:93970 stop:94494 length:525 start_codon:yes stop_codon:yes gene_type:complete
LKSIFIELKIDNSQMASESNNLSSYNKNFIPNGIPFRVGIVVSKWNSNVTSGLLKGAKDTLAELGVVSSNIITIEVPGSFELVYGAKIISKNKVDVIICLGSVIKGETKHFDYVCNAVSSGIKDLNIKFDIPVIFGVLTDNNLEQALNRSGGKLGNKGVESAVTAIIMADLNQK